MVYLDEVIDHNQARLHPFAKQLKWLARKITLPLEENAPLGWISINGRRDWEREGSPPVLTGAGDFSPRIQKVSAGQRPRFGEHVKA